MWKRIAAAMVVCAGCKGTASSSDPAKGSAATPAKTASGWSLGFTGKRSSIAQVAFAKDGGPCIAGTFDGDIAFDATHHFTARGTGYNLSDGFVACYGPDHALRWVQVVSGPGTDTMNGLAIGADGDVAVVGAFGMTDEGKVPISAELAGTRMEAVTPSHLFVARFAADGTPRWVRAIGAPATLAGGAIAFLSDGHVAIAGKQYGPIDVAGKHHDATRGGSYVAALGDDGQFIWYLASSAKDWSEVGGLLPVGATLYAVGSFKDTVAIGETTQLTSAGDSDGLVAAISTRGDVTWARAVGGSGADGIEGIAQLTGGDLAIAGWFGGTLHFHDADHVAKGDSDGFVAKLHANGEQGEWFTQIGGPGRDSLRALAVGSRAIYAAGSVGENFRTESNAAVPGTPVTVIGKMQGAIARFDLTGKLLGIEPVPSPRGLGLFDTVAVAPSGQVVVAGTTNNLGVVREVAP